MEVKTEVSLVYIKKIGGLGLGLGLGLGFGLGLGLDIEW